MSWSAAPGAVRQYRIRWKSLYTEEAGEKTIPGSTTTTVLDGLTPETRYQVSVFAVYGSGEGQPLAGEETTDGKLLYLLELNTYSPYPFLISPLHIIYLCSALFIFLNGVT